MVTWNEFASEAPEFADAVKARLVAHRHLTMATLKGDGSPRICGTEVVIRDGEVYLGGMPGNRRFADLRRDGRLGVHSGSDAPEVWSGDARIAGLGVEVTDPEIIERFRAGQDEVPPGPFELFRIELTEAVLVRLNEARSKLLIESWRPGEAVRRVER